MHFGELARVSREVAATRSRTRKLELLAATVARLDDAELDAGIAFLTGEPRQERLEVGWATVAALEAPAADEETLEVAAVDDAFARIAETTGPGSQAARRELLTALLARATAEEQQHLRGLLLRELRQGALAGLVTQAIARATGASEVAVRRAAMLRADLGDVARAARAGGDEALARFRLELFRPLQPMLAQSSGDLGALDGPTVVDVKLDGARVQVHRDDDDVRVYTRNLRDVTARVPEVVAAARRLGLRRGVLDGEAIVLRPDGRPEPFQVTMARFSTDDPEAAAAAPPLTVAFFDVLHADGEDVLDLPLARRLAVLDDVVPPDLRVERIVTASADEARAFLRDTLDAGHEGVMLKDPDAVYEAGRRGVGWRKVKPVHTLDLVVLAAEWGSGRRRGWLSNLHLGARDPDGGFVMLGKTFKGLTDETLAWQTDRLLALEERRTRGTVHVRPELVVEIAFDGVQTSPRYPGGVTLRFARVKGYRPDKLPAEADTIDTVRDIHAGRRRPAV
jgi:DNA ligase 1